MSFITNNLHQKYSEENITHLYTSSYLFFLFCSCGIGTKRFLKIIPSSDIETLVEEYMEFQATPKHHFPEYKQGETRIDVFLGDLF